MFGAAGVGISSRAVAPAKPAQSLQGSGGIQTDKTAYVAGEPVNILGSGFAPFERVTLQVRHGDGTSENREGHEPWFVDVDKDGSFTSTWTIGSDDNAGVNFGITATGSSRSAAASFERTARISADSPFLSPGSEIQVEGSGFNPNERVTIQLNNQDVLTTNSDASGYVTASLRVPKGSQAVSYTLQAIAPETGLVSNSLLVGEAPTVFAASLATLFQIDGDANAGYPTSPAPPAGSHDWNQVYTDFKKTTTGVSATGAINFFNDSIGTAVAGVSPTPTEDTFSGGLSKDTNDMNQWAYGSGAPQNKADLENAIAAAYIDPANNHTYLYVAADRADNSGSIALGVWFLQTPIATSGGKFYTANANGSANLSLPAHHVNGDLLLVANFGSGVATITSFTWNNGAIPATGTTLSSSIGNAVVNTVALDGAAGHPPAVSWPFKSSAAGAAANFVQPGEFFEAGVDLNLLFPGQTNFNFSSFIAETRASTSPTSTLSDFIVGHVSTAPDIKVTKVADSSTIDAGSQAGYTVTVSNSGVGDVLNAALTDSLPGAVAWSFAPNGNPSGNFILTGAGPGGQTLTLTPGLLLANNSQPIVAHIIGTPNNAGSLVNTATVSASNEDSAFLGNNQDSATITVNPKPVLTITADANPATLADDAFSKVYNGLPYSAGFTVRYEGFIGGDTPAVLGGTLSFGGTGTTATAFGSYPVTPSGQTSSKYVLNYVSGTLNITKAPLSITADALPGTGANDVFSKVYDGLVYTGFTVRYDGFVNGETSAVLTGTPTFSGTGTTATNVGNGYIVTPGGQTSGNYNITPVNGTLNITKAPLTITADALPGTGANDVFSKVYDGLVFSPFTVRYSGFVNGETSSVLGGTLSFSGTGSTAVNAGNGYVVTPGGQTSNNYLISFVDGSLNITKAQLSVTANHVDVDEGSAIPALTDFTVTGFVTVNGNSETVAVLGGTSPTLTTTATNSSAPGTSYTITTAMGSLTATNYTFSLHDGTLTIKDVAPVIDMSIGTITLNLGDGFSRPASFTDAGSGVTSEQWTITVNYGDGTSTGPTTVIDPGSIPVSRVYTGTGQYTVTVTVTDNYGAFGPNTDTKTFTVYVNAK